MKLDHIRVDGRDGEKSSKLIEAIRKLPDGTITGLT